MAGINPVIDPLQRKLVCGPEEGQNTTVDGFQVNVIGDTGSGLYNAGDGINIEGSTINVALTAGYRGAVSGSTVGFDPTGDIVTVAGASVTLQPDTAYKIYATASAVTLNANVPAAGKWAYEGHLEIFVAGTGYIVTGTNVVLANALEPDSVNNCTVRFHDGLAIISVEDHIAGYVVVSATGTTAGTLPYGLTSATQEYVAFDATTNGAVIDLAGATANGEKHIIGNGYTSTTLTGTVDCGTSKFTVANLALSDVQVTGGTMTLGDVWIPSGSTVAVSGGGLAVEKVAGAGTINLGQTQLSPQTSQGAFNGLTASGVTITNGSAATYGGVGALWGASQSYFDVVFSKNSCASAGGCFRFTANARGDFVNCQFVSNTAGTSCGAVIGAGNAIVNLSGCTFSDNVGSNGVVESDSPNTVINVSDCKFGVSQNLWALSETSINLLGSNAILAEARGNGSYVFSSGAILDLTGNTNSTPIAPGGGITFEAGGATVYPSAGLASAYELGGVTCVDLTNMNTVHTGSSTTPIGMQNVIIRNVTMSANTLHQLRGAAGSMYIKDTTLVNYTTTNDANGSQTLTLAGSNTDVRPIFTSSSTIILSNGTTLRITTDATNYCKTNGTLNIGAGCVIISREGVSADINGGIAGTFENSHINIDGTVTANE